MTDEAEYPNIDFLEAKAYLKTGDQGRLSPEDQKRLDIMLRRSDEAEKKKYLEHTIDLGTSPVGVIQLKLGNTGCTKTDIERALEIRNNLIGFSEGVNNIAQKNALVNIHRESDSLHVSFVLLNEAGFKSFEQIVDDLKVDGVNARSALGVPEENDQQYATIKEGRFTIYGSAVLAMARGEKAGIDQEIPTYQLSNEKVAGALVGGKRSSIRKVGLDPKNINWAVQEQIDKIPEDQFRRIDISEVQELQINLDDYVFVKLDINYSSRRLIENKVDVDDETAIHEAVERRRLNIASDFNNLVVTAELIRLSLESPDLDTHITGVLGDSLVLILPKKEVRIIGDDDQERMVSDQTVFEYIMNANFVDSKSETFLKPKLSGNEGRGHVSVIELPFVDKKTSDRRSAYHNRRAFVSRKTFVGKKGRDHSMITLFKAGGEVLAFDRIWDGEAEHALEEFHKQTKKPVTRVVGYKDLEEV